MLKTKSDSRFCPENYKNVQRNFENDPDRGNREILSGTLRFYSLQMFLRFIFLVYELLQFEVRAHIV